MKLDTWLARQGLSYRTFAKMVGVSPQAVSFWMSGVYRPGMEQIAAIEKATKGEVTLSDLMKIKRRELSTE